LGSEAGIEPVAAERAPDPGEPVLGPPRGDDATRDIEPAQRRRRRDARTLAHRASARLGVAPAAPPPAAEGVRIMAARIATEVAGLAQDARAGWRGAEAAFNDWAEAQLDSCTAGLGQVATAQQAVLSFWLGVADTSARAWCSACALDPSPPAPAAWAEAWSAWLPFVQRGGEQLG
jgi:hypothetical protein